MQKESKSDFYKKAGVSFGTVLGVCFVVAFVLLSQTGNVVVEQVVERQWQGVPVGEINFGGTNSSIVEIYIVLTGQTYTANLSNTSGYWLAGASHHSQNNTHVSSNVNHSTAFDIVAKVRWNKTHCLAANNSWDFDYVNLTVDCPGLSINDLAMDEYNITGQTQCEYVWVNYVADNSGSGYQLSRGQSINQSGGVPTCLFNATAYF